MKLKAMVGSVIGALVGALLWCWIAYAQTSLAGYMAIPLCLLTGLGARLGGGRGSAMGIFSVAVSLVAICAAYTVNTKRIHPVMLRSYARAKLGDEGYVSYLQKVEAFKEIASAEEYPSFMIRYRVVGKFDPAAITRAEIDVFERKEIPIYEYFMSENPDVDAWREKIAEDYVGEKMAEFNWANQIMVNLEANSFEIILFVIGLVLAFKIAIGPVRVEE